MTTRWHYRVDGRDVGPVDLATLQQMASDDRLLGADEIRSENSAEWVRAETVSGLFPQAAEDGDLDSMLSGELAQVAGPVRVAASSSCYCRTRSEELGPMSF